MVVVVVVLVSLSPPGWEEQVGWSVRLAHLSRGSSCDQRRGVGPCRSEPLLLGEQMPDGFGEPAGDLYAGHRRAALLAQAGLGALVVVTTDRMAAAWTAASTKAQRS
jgi:hypothetical protein